MPPASTPTSTATSTPTPTTCATSDTGYHSPTLETADTGGNGDGFEWNPAKAFEDGASWGTDTDGSGDRHRYYDYGFSIPSNCTITGIEVRLDWWLDDTSGTNSLSVELS